MALLCFSDTCGRNTGVLPSGPPKTKLPLLAISVWLTDTTEEREDGKLCVCRVRGDEAKSRV